MFKIIDYIKTYNWEGAIVEDLETNKRYITNGVYKWEAREERLKKCTIVEKINIHDLINRWNKYFIYSKLILK